MKREDAVRRTSKTSASRLVQASTATQPATCSTIPSANLPDTIDAFFFNEGEFTFNIGSTYFFCRGRKLRKNNAYNDLFKKKKKNRHHTTFFFLISLQDLVDASTSE